MASSFLSTSFLSTPSLLLSLSLLFFLLLLSPSLYVAPKYPGMRIPANDYLKSVCLNSSSIIADKTIRKNPLCRRPMDNAHHCAGELYDAFLPFVRCLAAITRPVALPPDISVFMIGNSHMRQVYQTLACEFADEQIKYHKYHAEHDGHQSGVEMRGFENGFTLYMSTNNWAVFRDDWAEVHSNFFGKSVFDMDVIVLGPFNNNVQKYASKNGRRTSHPPSISAFSQIKGMFVYLPMFDNRGGCKMISKPLNTVLESPDYNLTSGLCISTREYIPYLGECSILEHACRDDDHNSHRCIPGHPDLISWTLLDHIAGFAANRDEGKSYRGERVFDPLDFDVRSHIKKEKKKEKVENKKEEEKEKEIDLNILDALFGEGEGEGERKKEGEREALFSIPNSQVK